MHAFRLGYFYLKHYFKSFRLHGIHSPFVFNLYNQVICHTGFFGAFSPIEKLRRVLHSDSSIIEVKDFGAGSRVNNSFSKRINQIAKSAANPPRVSQLLFRLVNFQQPATIIEIGTSLGITTAYLASARKKAQVYTLEGCLATAQQARNNFKKLNLHNIHLVSGNFEATLPPLLNKLPQVDCILFDGNHRYEPTLRYFEWCLAKKSEESIFIFDDIYWSPGMERAWKQICAHPEVMISIDLFYVGLVFFRKNQPKQHFTIRL